MMDELTSVAVQPSQPPHNKKILIIDDTPSIVEYTVHVLHKLGYTDIVKAYNGVEGLERFYSERPDCVIVDVRMPGLDGYQVVRTIRGDLSAANTPLIILSAFQERDQRLTGILSGVDEYLGKPFKPSALASTLERVMRITPEERAQRMEHLADDALAADDDDTE